jgi:hypothetical protein
MPYGMPWERMGVTTMATERDVYADQWTACADLMRAKAVEFDEQEPVEVVRAIVNARSFVDLAKGHNFPDEFVLDMAKCLKRCADLLESPETRTGTVGALLLLSDLRNVMGTLRERSPIYEPGTGPTAADNCRQILEMIEFCLKQLSVYVGG